MERITSPLQRANDIEKGVMAPFSEDPVTSEHALPLTAPGFDLPTTGLPERPPVSDAELEERAKALGRQWVMVPANPKAGGLSARLVRQKQRLTEILRACRKTASLQELTPQLELLESTRMLESALIAGDDTAARIFDRPGNASGSGREQNSETA